MRRFPWGEPRFPLARMLGLTVCGLVLALRGESCCAWRRVFFIGTTYIAVGEDSRERTIGR